MGQARTINIKNTEGREKRSAPATLKNRQENMAHRYYPGLRKKVVISMKRLWQKNKKNVFGSFAFLMFFLYYGTVGAVECDTLPLFEGNIRSIIFLALWALFTYLTQRDCADKDEARVAELEQQNLKTKKQNK
jgi:hypothetical protein